VFVLEVMGRHAGWITAAVGMAEDADTPIPLLLLFPEIPFDEAKILALVDEKTKRFGYCCIGVSEGLLDAQGKLMAEAGTRDAFGHAQLGGVGPLVASMEKTSTKTFVLEVMGRHAGWITAAVGMADDAQTPIPLLLLFPEIPFDEGKFLALVDAKTKEFGYCCIGVSEGLQDAQGHLMAEAGTRDAFGHAQLGGVGPLVANLVKDRLKLKYHWAVADYLQRAARHLASRTDVEQSYAVGRAAVEMALAGRNAVMPAIVRVSDRPYRWKIEAAPLAKVANTEKMLPRSYITGDGFGITARARTYLAPLIRGEDPPPYRDGLPQYVRLRNVPVPRKLATEFEV
jgi:6-phosphofructokinase 1